MSGLAGGPSTIPANPRPGIEGFSPARKALRSMPAQNVPPTPVMIPETRLGSPSRRSMAAPMASAVAVLIALRASGRLMETTSTPSTTSVRTGSEEVEEGVELISAPSGSRRRAGSSRR